MGRKIIIDADPGIDDAVALCIALFDPRVEVVAVTATEGNAWADQTTRNVQAILELLDPPKLPRIGVATPAENAPPFVDSRQIHGPDGLGNIGFNVSELHHQHPSAKLICDEVRAAPGDVTIVTLGPLTNVARAFQRDPELPGLINQLVMMGGTTIGFGNATPAAEFNIHYDPVSARSVFQSRTTKTLIPLDVTRQVKFDMDLLDKLPSESTRAGRLLHHIVPFSFRAYHQRLGLESIQLHDAVAIVAAANAELFETEEMAGDVETTGELTAGTTVFDRRPNRQWRPNMEVATGVDIAGVKQYMMSGLSRAGSLT